MTHDRLHAYHYVNQRYSEVRRALLTDTLGLFQRATTVATSSANAMHAQLHGMVGPIDVSTEIEIRITGVEAARSPIGEPATRIVFEWSAAHHPRAFPVMHATLTAYALTPTETQLELEGLYEPPMGVLGKAIDAVIGRRVAEASVQRFLFEVAARLREELATAPEPAASPPASS